MQPLQIAEHLVDVHDVPVFRRHIEQALPMCIRGAIAHRHRGGVRGVENAIGSGDHVIERRSKGVGRIGECAHQVDHQDGRTLAKADALAEAPGLEECLVALSGFVTVQGRYSPLKLSPDPGRR